MSCAAPGAAAIAPRSPTQATAQAQFDKPVDNIGDKVFGSTTGYAAYAAQHIYPVNIPGCATPGRVFVGQRKESFYIAVGKIFDLINLNPLGPESGGNNNDLEGQEHQHAGDGAAHRLRHREQRPGDRRLHHAPACGRDA